MTTSLRKRVERGAALLDKVRSKRMKSWRDKIDTEKLDIDSPCNCVLGQVYENYYEALYVLKWRGGDVDGHGFRSTANDPRPLTLAWRKYIEATR